ncbi:hypothetical protein AC249_AIPGENE23419, partial [Exaiptasia diaphana]
AETASECKPLYLGIYHAEEIKCTCKEKSCFLPGQIMFTVKKGDPSSFSTSNKPTVTVSLVHILTIFAILQTVIH